MIITSEIRDKFSRLRYTACLLCAFSLLPPVWASAQPKFQLQRTKKESTPFIMRLLGGYNGVAEPSDALQDLFENTQSTQWGGVMAAVQGLFPIDTVLVPISVGADLFYHRMIKRFLGRRPEVFYASDGSSVNADETVSGYGGNAILAMLFTPRLSLHLAAGALYIHGDADVESEVTGLFQPVWMFTAHAAVNYALLTYDHGSIDATFRFTRGFGVYGSFHLQSLLGFTFNF